MDMASTAPAAQHHQQRCRSCHGGRDHSLTEQSRRGGGSVVSARACDVVHNPRARIESGGRTRTCTTSPRHASRRHASRRHASRGGPDRPAGLAGYHGCMGSGPQLRTVRAVRPALRRTVRCTVLCAVCAAATGAAGCLGCDGERFLLRVGSLLGASCSAS